MSRWTSWPYREIWCVDFEFGAPDGERPAPICMVAHELRSGRHLRLWQDELAFYREAPIATGPDTLLVAYYASAELGCFRALGWPDPSHVLDLYVEFRNATNGLPTPCGAGLLGALAYFGLDSIEAAEKDSMRTLSLRGGPWSDQEKRGLLDYCASDVQALEQLITAMDDQIDLPRALLRGRSMKAAAAIEWRGIPVDAPLLTRLDRCWTGIQTRLIDRIDASYQVFEGGSFKAARFAAWLARTGIPWPRLESGSLDLSDDTFREMARSHPTVAPLRELRVALAQMRLSDLAVGHDGRNRCLLSAFRARTGRNQPSNARFIFGPAVWMRGLIRPEPGQALAYLDWSQQEFGIAAALSGDRLMQAAYLTGDPYLEFARQAGAVPPHATTASHKAQREQFKACVLAVQYGMGEESLAQRIGQPVAKARELLRLHRETYRAFWDWSDAAVDHAMLMGHLHTVFGWRVQVGANSNPRFLRNFLMQANGAEMLRLACIFAVESAIGVCAPIHDAMLIEAPLETIDDAVAKAQALMTRASELVLSGFALRSEAKFIRHPERHVDERGARMWDTAIDLLVNIEGTEADIARPNVDAIDADPAESADIVRTMYAHVATP